MSSRHLAAPELAPLLAWFAGLQERSMAATLPDRSAAK